MKNYKIFLTFLWVASYLFTEGSPRFDCQGRPVRWNHDYSKTLVMKMGLSVVKSDGSTLVLCDLDKALKLISETDNLTLGVNKIIYLVGWQYNGHDDKYPAFFEVNPAFRRPGDPDARTSLIWLMAQAEKYHTTISLHINMTDAYEDSPLWQEYVNNDLISKNANGSLLAIGNYNNRKAYQINYRNEWEKGFAQERIDRLLELLPPLKKAGTIHIDAWIARPSKGHEESAILEAEYQRKIARYWLSKGIEPTSEWVMDYMTGLVPFYWHFNNRTQADYLRIPASQCTGSHMNPDLRNSDFGLEFLFGTSMYGENRFPNTRNKINEENWEGAFARDFFLNFPQYYFLNRQGRLGVEGSGRDRTATYTGNIKVSLADSSVTQNERFFRKGNTLCFPALWRKDNSLVAYSLNSSQLDFLLPENWSNFRKAGIFLVTKNGLISKGHVTVEDHRLRLELIPEHPVLVVPLKK